MQFSKLWPSASLFKMFEAVIFLFFLKHGRVSGLAPLGSGEVRRDPAEPDKGCHSPKLLMHRAELHWAGLQAPREGLGGARDKLLKVGRGQKQSLGTWQLREHSTGWNRKKRACSKLQGPQTHISSNNVLTAGALWLLLDILQRWTEATWYSRMAVGLNCSSALSGCVILGNLRESIKAPQIGRSNPRSKHSKPVLLTIIPQCHTPTTGPFDCPVSSCGERTTS